LSTNVRLCFPSSARWIQLHVEILLYITVYPQYNRRIKEKSLAMRKTTTLTFRIEPRLKEALCSAAGREHRSIANMVEVLIRDYCVRNGITIPEQQALPLDDNRTPRSVKR
jgi:hypothetical protein